MRIFYAADHEPFPGNHLWHNNLYLPLVDLGFQIVNFDYDLTPHFKNADPSEPCQRQFIEDNRPRLEQALLEQIGAAHRAERIDVFFSYFYSAFCSAAVVRAIRAMGICTINWYCNASFQFHLVKEIAPVFDYCLVPEKFRLDDYRRVGANPIYCQEAANPNLYKPYDLPYLYDVTFVGQQYGDRSVYLKYLVDQRIKARVWGSNWQAHVPSWRRVGKRVVRTFQGRAGEISPELPRELCGGLLTDNEMVKLFSQSRINLGFTNVGNTHLLEKPIQQVRLRDFEVPMSGGFYLVQAYDELADFFVPGKEIVFFYNKQDLVEKAKYYLENESERQAIRQAGLRRARAEHSWQKRLQSAFHEIGLV